MTYTEEQQRDIRRLAEAYQSYSAIRNWGGFNTPRKPKALRHYGYELDQAQKKTGIELVSMDEMEAAVLVADLEWPSKLPTE